MNRRSLFKKIVAIMAAACAAPLVSKSLAEPKTMVELMELAAQKSGAEQNAQRFTVLDWDRTMRVENGKIYWLTDGEWITQEWITGK